MSIMMTGDTNFKVPYNITFLGLWFVHIHIVGQLNGVDLSESPWKFYAKELIHKNSILFFTWISFIPIVISIVIHKFVEETGT